MTHLAQECLRFGPLDSFSGFKFENTNKTLKNLVQTYKDPLRCISKQLKCRSSFISKSTRHIVADEVISQLTIYAYLALAFLGC